MGQSATGIVTANFYSTTFDTPASKAFTEAMKAKYNSVSNASSASGYVAAMAIAAAIEAVNGKIEDKKAFMAALAKTELPTSPLGRFRFDAKQNVIFDMKVTRVESRNGGPNYPWVIDNLGNDLDQFWQYKP